jgi:hypothetical protein
VSFDKGFHSASNQTDLAVILDRVVLPKKGRLSVADKAREQDPEFVRLRHGQSAVESAINAEQQETPATFSARITNSAEKRSFLSGTTYNKYASLCAPCRTGASTPRNRQLLLSEPLAVLLSR